jgi:hypothetical protein
MGNHLVKQQEYQLPTREGESVEKYNIVLKTLLSKCRESFLEYFLDLDLEDVEVLEIH